MVGGAREWNRVRLFELRGILSLIRTSSSSIDEMIVARSWGGHRE